MNDWWKLFLAGLLAFLFGVLLDQMRLGGRRRRLGRDLKEALELHAMLKSRPEAQRAVSNEVDRLVGRYLERRLPFWAGFPLFLVMAVASVLVLSVVVTALDPPGWVVISLTLAGGLLTAWGSDRLTERIRRRVLSRR